MIFNKLILLITTTLMLFLSSCNSVSPDIVEVTIKYYPPEDNNTWVDSYYISYSHCSLLFDGEQRTRVLFADETFHVEVKPGTTITATYVRFCKSGTLKDTRINFTKKMDVPKHDITWYICN